MGAAGAAAVLGQFKDFDEVFAVFDVASADTDSVPAEITALVEERISAKKNKNYARSDEIRKELQAKGWIVEDTPAGPRVKKVN